MLLGIDVGGTHTDAALIEKGKVKARYKATTDFNNLLKSINEAIENVIADVDISKIKKVNLSTTLSTNAIIEKKIEDVTVLVSSGPGINPEEFSIGDYHILKGSIDHRGTEIEKIESENLNNIIQKSKSDGIKVFAIVTKFSTRNSSQENFLSKEVEGFADFITSGHKLSGQLNFPRRIATAFYNSAVWRIYNSFTDSIEKSIKNFGIEAKINILKADGGTMPLLFSKEYPVESILSGPAASIMGIVALSKIEKDSIILDIGGTTTDIAIFAEGAPLIEKDGISIDGHNTLVRSLNTRSIGVGGDSVIKIINNQIHVGPEREGPAMAHGGNTPTFVDAMNYMNLTKTGDLERSRSGINKLSEAGSISPEELSEKVINYALDKIKKEVESILFEINNKPVYTIHEMLEGKKVIPEEIHVMGGPADGVSKVIEEKFKLKVKIPENFDVANAIGAALAKSTFDIELFADTGTGKLLIPNIDISKKVSHSYRLDDAKEDARKYLIEYMKKHNIDVTENEVEIIESSSFSMMGGYQSSGKDLRVKCQIKPGVVIDLF